MQGVDKVLAKFDKYPPEIEKALVSTLNQLGAKAVTEAKRGIRQEYNLKDKDVAKGIERIYARKESKGRGARYFTLITAKGERIPLFSFGGRPATPPVQKGVPIARRKLATVQILKSGPRRAVTRDVETSHMPFVARMTKGFGGSDTDHIGIFTRTGKWLRNRGKGKHQVIRQLKSEGIPFMFMKRGGDAMLKLVSEKGMAMFRKNLEFFSGKIVKK